MALVRAGSQRLMRWRDPLTVTIGSAAVGTAGFLCFWAAPSLPVAGVGLLVTGMGIAMLYPVSVARVVAAWPDRPDAAAARAAVASGLAIGVVPLALVAAAEVVGLRAAYLLVPGLLLALLARTVARRGGQGSVRSGACSRGSRSGRPSWATATPNTARHSATAAPPRPYRLVPMSTTAKEIAGPTRSVRRWMT